MGHFPFGQPAGKPQQLPQRAVQLRAGSGKVEAQHNQTQIRLLRLADDQLVGLGRQLPVDLMQAVAGAVFAQIVDLGKAAAGLWMIGAVLKMAEVRQHRRLLRLRLDGDGAGVRQAQRQAEKPQRVAHAALAGLKGLHACVARINAQRKAERSCKLQPLLAHLAAHGVGYRQAQAAAGYRKLCHVPGGQPVLHSLPAEAARRKLRFISSAEHGRQADEQRKNRQQHGEHQQEKRKPAGIKAVKDHGCE